MIGVAAIGVIFFLVGRPLFLRRPNVVLITIDALGPDHRGCYGYSRDTSPAIDRIAKEGVIFTQVIVQGPSTAISLSSLMTSNYARTHGVYEWAYSINPALLTLAQVLKKNGYATCALGEVISGVEGLERGFDYFKAKGKDERLTQESIAWLKKKQKGAFFLWIHYFSPHNPYRFPAGHQFLFYKGKAAGNLPDRIVVPQRVSRDEWSQYFDLYDEEIRGNIEITNKLKSPGYLN